MEKIETFKNGYVWLDIWSDNNRIYFEPYVVKRDGSGRSSKYTIEEILVMKELKNIAIKKYLTY